MSIKIELLENKRCKVKNELKTAILTAENNATMIEVSYPSKYKEYSKRVDFLTENNESWTLSLFCPELESDDNAFNRLEFEFTLPSNVTVHGELKMQFIAYLSSTELDFIPFTIVSLQIDESLDCYKATSKNNPDLILLANSNARHALEFATEAKEIASSTKDSLLTAVEQAEQANSKASYALEQAEQIAEESLTAVSNAEKSAKESADNVASALLKVELAEQKADSALTKANSVNDDLQQVKSDVALLENDILDHNALIAENSNKISELKILATSADNKADSSITKILAVESDFDTIKTDFISVKTTAENADTQATQANVVANEAKTKSETAIQTANKAQDTAILANTVALSASNNASITKELAENLQTETNFIKTDTTKIKVDIIAIDTKAETAQTTASDAISLAETATTTATTAVEKADNALSEARSASEKATSADTKASSAITDASYAKELSENVEAENLVLTEKIADIENNTTTALANSNTAQEKATLADNNAGLALTDSATALTKAIESLNNSVEANLKAQQAINDALLAKQDALSALEKAVSALTATDTLKGKLTDKTDKSDFIDLVETLTNRLNYTDRVIDNLQTGVDTLDQNKAPLSHVGSSGTEQHSLANGVVAGFSLNNFSASDKAKLDSVESGAQKNIYVQSDWIETNNASTAYIKNKPLSMPASDVYEWAKQPIKPTYTASEVGAVPLSRTVNNKILSNDIILSATDVGAVPTSRTINNKSLSSNITLSASDVSAVPTTRTVNSRSLSSNITLTKSDIDLGNVENVKQYSTSNKPFSNITSSIEGGLGSAYLKFDNGLILQWGGVYATSDEYEVKLPIVYINTFTVFVCENDNGLGHRIVPLTMRWGLEKFYIKGKKYGMYDWFAIGF